MNYDSIIIDGYNAIYKLSSLKTSHQESSETARDKFALFLQKWQRQISFKGTIYVVFDGQSQNYLDEKSTVHGIHFCFSYHDSDADNYIISMLKREGKQKKFLVVTDDNYIRNHCKVYSADWKSVAYLTQKKKYVKNKNTILSNKNISHIDQISINKYLKEQWGIA